MRAPPRDRPPYGAAAGAVAAVLALYLVTLAPTTQFWDTAEYLTAAKVLGIPHPPGNPLFVLLAHVWGLLPIVGHYALRINLFAALTSALASGLLFLVAERFLRNVLPEPRWARIAAAFGGVLVGATSFTVWNQSVVNEKVYTLSLLSIALVLWLVVHWGDEPPGERRDHWLLLIVYLLALSATNHLMGILAGPALLAYVIFTDPRVVFRWRMWLVAALVAAVGWSVFVLLPIRAEFYPPINEGEPVCGSLSAALLSIYTFGGAGCEALSDVLSREQYQKGPLLPRQAELLWQYVNYLQYFSWQFAHDLGPRARNLLALAFGALGVFGAVRQWQRDRRGALAMTALMVTVTVLLVFYLDFKYGYSIRAGENLLREVRERDYFFIASFQLWGVWVALGLGAALAGIARLARERLGDARSWYAAAPVLLVALIPLLGNRLTAPRHGEWLPRDFAWDILQSVEPHGILITAGDNDTFPLWYMQEVEGVRPDVLIANTSLMNTLWHARQLKRRPAYPFDSATATALYRDRSWPAPSEPALSLEYGQIDALPPVTQLRERSVFRVGRLRAVIAPRVLERRDILTLQLIQDNLGKRPIYFSRTAGGYGDGFGLTPYLLGQGLVRRLVEDSLTNTDSTVAIRSLGWVDVPTTETLLFDVYHPESAARERPTGWVDRPSEGILSLYGLLYSEYARWATAWSAATGVEADSTTLERAQRAAEYAERMFRQTSFFR